MHMLGTVMYPHCQQGCSLHILTQHGLLLSAGPASAQAAQDPEGLDHWPAQGPEPWHTY
jgi:hypothetical protein